MIGLLEAAQEGDLACIKACIKGGAAVNEARETAFTNACSTALHVVAENGNLACTQFLLDNGANAVLTDAWGHTAAHLAAADGHSEVLEALLAKCHEVVHIVDDVDRTPMHMAAQAGHAACVSALLKAGAQVDPRSILAEVGEDVLPLSSAVHSAASYGHVDCLTLLLQACSASAAVNLADNFDRTPLHLAAENGHVDCLQALLAAGAHVGAECAWGATALHFAIKGGHVAAVVLLIEGGASVNAADAHGMTPLHMAAQQGCATIAKALLQAGANLNPSSSRDETPLSLAMQLERQSVVCMLLGAGASMHNVKALLAGCSPALHAAVRAFTQLRSIAAVGSMRRYAERAAGQQLCMDMNHCILARIFDIDEECLRLLLNIRAEGCC